MHHTRQRLSPSLLIGLVSLFVALIAATGAASAHAEVTPGTYVIYRCTTLARPLTSPAPRPTTVRPLPSSSFTDSPISSGASR